LEKIRFLTDEDFRRPILDGVRRRLPDLDIVRVQDVGLRSFRDEVVLEFAALDNRIVLSHDLASMKNHALNRLSSGLIMPGLFLIPQSVPIGVAIHEIVFVAECSRDDEWNGLIRYLPL